MKFCHAVTSAPYGSESGFESRIWHRILIFVIRYFGIRIHSFSNSDSSESEPGLTVLSCSSAQRKRFGLFEFKFRVKIDDKFEG